MFGGYFSKTNTDMRRLGSLLPSFRVLKGLFAGSTGRALGSVSNAQPRPDGLRATPLRTCLAVTMLSVILLAVGFPDAAAGTVPSSEASSLSATPVAEDTVHQKEFEAAVRLWKEGRVAEAQRRLESLWTEDRSLYEPGLGSVAYWYGRTVEETEGPAEALKVWQVGLSTLGMRDHFDPRLNDAYVRTIFGLEKTERYPQATGAYLDLFDQADQVPEATQDTLNREGMSSLRSGRRIIDRHVSQMAFLLREPARSWLLRKVDQERTTAPAYALRSGKGPAVAGWWRGKDPVPRTGRNERVEEHLRRVQVAQEKYEFEDRWSGFDQRGEIYVRLGSPGETREISLSGLKRQQFPEAPIKGIESGLPKHEIWLYPEHGEEAVYIFVWRQGRYRLSGPQDLLPPDVRGPYMSENVPDKGGERGEAKLAVLAMEQILRELRVNSEYNRFYEDVYQYVMQVDIPGSTRGEVGRSKEDGSIHSAQRARPRNFAKTVQSDGEKTRRQVADVRREIVPQQETEVGENLSSVPVQLRRARFLDEGGTTRTVLYWTHPAEELQGRGLFDVTAVQRAGDYSRTLERSRRYVMNPSEEGLQGWVLPMQGGEGTYHLHLQVDQYEVTGTSEAGGVQRGEQAAQTIVRLDSVEALETGPGQLTMSDLLPGLAPSRKVPSQENAPGGMALSPYPHGSLFPGIDMRLYFELYGLAFGPDDRTEYSVGYTVEKKESGGIFRLFRDQERRTTTESTYEGTSRRTQEYIQLELGELDDAKEVRITVEVTDEVTDRTAERSLTFDVAK